GSIINSFSLPDNYTVQEFSVHPQYPGLIAILARKSGVQALWIVEPDKIASFYHNDPDIVFDNGSVFDPQWHPVQPLLLFTSDFTGVMNIYQYDSQLNTVHQITNSLFNSMEASYSPDGDKLIYIHQTQNLRLPAVLEKNLFYNKKVDPVFWKPSEDVKNRINRPLMNRAVQPDTTQWVNEKYQTGIGWLKPRLWTPVIRNTGDVRQIGLRFYSTDDLAQNTYSFEITRAQNRLWYDLNYRFSGFFPGFGIAAKSEPLFPSLRVEDDTGQSRIFNFMLEDREFGINIPFRLLLERNSRFSSLTVRPKYELTQLKFFDIGSSNRSLSNFSTIHSVGLTVVFNYRLRQFIRNVQPNAGWVLYAQTEIDLNNSDFDFTFQNIDFSGRFSDRRGLRGGIFRYVAPFSSKNHSLRFGLEFLTQTELPQFNNQDLVSDAFSGDVFRSSNNLSFLSTRYTIPLTHPDDGGFLLPLYLSNIYLVLFTQTVSDLNAASLSDISDHSRTILGSGIRSRFRISNLAIDIGISFGFEPSRNDFTFLFGTF
ncbi:MAG: TolB family protein, partial [Balneolaceae bacterium]